MLCDKESCAYIWQKKNKTRCAAIFLFTTDATLFALDILIDKSGMIWAFIFDNYVFHFNWLLYISCLHVTCSLPMTIEFVGFVLTLLYRQASTTDTHSHFFMQAYITWCIYIHIYTSIYTLEENKIRTKTRKLSENITEWVAYETWSSEPRQPQSVSIQCIILDIICEFRQPHIRHYMSLDSPTLNKSWHTQPYFKY